VIFTSAAVNTVRSFAALVLVTACAGVASSAPAQAQTLCGTQRVPVAGGKYVVQNNEYFSRTPECVRVSGTGFRVVRSSITMPDNGGPGGYPAIYQGCHWGHCSSGGLASAPVRVRNLTPGTVTTTWRTSQPRGSNVYDVAYDIWFNKTPRASGQPDCTELMVWLNHRGAVQPYGAPIADDVRVGGHDYDVWGGPQRWGRTITYEMTAGRTAVTGLDIGTLAQDAVRRGYLPKSCYLIDVEAGFELWHGGTGLATNAFSLAVRRG
jgi:hypothetical protein